MEFSNYHKTQIITKRKLSQNAACHKTNLHKTQQKDEFPQERLKEIHPEK
jgi:hypothetical protein